MGRKRLTQPSAKLVFPSLIWRIRTMYGKQGNVTSTAHFIPWNKDRLIGPKPPLRLREIRAIRIRLQMARAPETLPFSTWQSIVSFGAAISSSFKFVMWRTAERRFRERLLCSRRPHIRWSLSWLTRPERRVFITCY